MTSKDADTTKRDAKITVSGQTMMACQPLALVAANLKEREKDFDDLREDLGTFRKETTDQLHLMHKDIKALNHAKRDGGLWGSLTGGVASGVALLGAYVWSKFTGGG